MTWTATTQWLLGQLGIIIGSIGIGFAIGSKVMARRAKRMIEAETLEENDTILDAKVIR